MSIKATLTTKGWQQILKIIEEEKTKLCDCRNINTKNTEEFGSLAIANKQAVKLVDNILQRVNKESQDLTKNQISYK